jgi:hypothetical protein
MRCELLERSCMFGKEYLSGVVTMLRQWKSPHRGHDPSFFGIICNVEAKGDVERRIMPVDSKHFYSALAISSLSGSRQWAMAKTEGCLPM